MGLREADFHPVEAVLSSDEAALPFAEDAFEAAPIVFDHVEWLFTLRNHRA